MPGSLCVIHDTVSGTPWEHNACLEMCYVVQIVCRSVIMLHACADSIMHLVSITGGWATPSVTSCNVTICHDAA